MSSYSILVGACAGIALIFYVGIIWLSAIKSFLKDKSRGVDDPQKQNYPLSQVFLAPVLFPLVFMIKVLFWLTNAVFAIIFLPLFAIALVVMRKWPESRLSKLLNWLGEYILGNSLWMFVQPAPQHE